MIGEVLLGRYRVVRQLGEGTMGRVYLGEQRVGEALRNVAIKVLAAECAAWRQGVLFNTSNGKVIGIKIDRTAINQAKAASNANPTAANAIRAARCELTPKSRLSPDHPPQTDQG